MLRTALTLILFCSATPAFAFQPIDRGGPILPYLSAIAQHNRTGETKVIAGDCMSACTLWLKAKRVCAMPDAVFWFHGAHDLQTGRYSPEWTQVLKDYVPPRVRALVDARGGYDSLAYVAIQARDLFRVGVRPCRR